MCKEIEKILLRNIKKSRNCTHKSAFLDGVKFFL